MDLAKLEKKLRVAANQNLQMTNAELADEIRAYLHEDIAVGSIDGKSLDSLLDYVVPRNISQITVAPYSTISRWKSAYVLLDTSNAAETTTYTAKWLLSNNSLLRSGTVNAPSDLRDIIGIRAFPIKATFNITLDTGQWNYLVNRNNNFTILIDEFKAQSFTGRDGRSFHFVFFPQSMDTSITNPYIEYTTSGKGDGWMWFDQPFTEVSSLTVSLADPFSLVKFSDNVRTLIPIELIYDGKAED